MASSELCDDVPSMTLNCSRLAPAPETSTITDSFAARLGLSVLDKTRPLDLWILRDVKQKLCYVFLDYDTKPTSTTESSDSVTTCELPDDNILTVGATRFRCSEVLFQPKTSELTDGCITVVDVKPFRCAEVLFQSETYELHHENINAGAKCFRNAEVLFQPSFQPAESTSPFSRATWNATCTSARICTPVWCCQAARTCSKRF